MKNNKLIAEFMEVHEIMHDEYSEYDFDDNTLDVVHEDDLQYHTSWDWLMPVMAKLVKDFGGGWQFEEGYDLNTRYNAVVKIINQLNNEKNIF